MKKYFLLFPLFCLPCLSVELEQATNEQLVNEVSRRMSNGGTTQCSSSSLNPYVKCIGLGYQPSTCKDFIDGCNAGAVACLEQSYYPSYCISNPGQGSGTGHSCFTKETNGYIACIKLGFQPSACNAMKNGCSPGQAACLNQGYMPSSCVSM